MRQLLAATAALLLPGCIHVTETRTTAPRAGCVVGEQMVETTLFLGMATPTGSVSEDQFARFVEAEVTPRWREGFTILSGQGLWYSEQRQVTEREPSRVLVRFHDGSAQASAGIEAIRAAYIKAFTQDAVLRTDRNTCADF
jgi:Protein of unknown function (DUF3574)